MEKHQVIALIAGSIYGKVPIAGIGLKEHLAALAVEEAEKIYRMSEGLQNFIEKNETASKSILEVGINFNMPVSKNRIYLWTRNDLDYLYFRDYQPFLARDNPTYYSTAEEALQAGKSKGYSVKVPKELAKS